MFGRSTRFQEAATPATKRTSSGWRTSSPLSFRSDFQVARGRYGFRVGESELFFSFNGGSLESFARAVNERAGDIVNARVVRNTATTQILLIEANRTGSENTLSFLEDARTLAQAGGEALGVRADVGRRHAALRGRSFTG